MRRQSERGTIVARRCALNESLEFTLTDVVNAAANRLRRFESIAFRAVNLLRIERLVAAEFEHQRFVRRLAGQNAR